MATYLVSWMFVQKRLSAVLGLTLRPVGFEPNVQQTQTARRVILALRGFMPAARYAIAGMLPVRCRLNEKEHVAIRLQLDAHHASRDE